MSATGVLIFWTYTYFIHIIWYVVAFFTILDVIQTVQYYRQLRKQSPNDK